MWRSLSSDFRCLACQRGKIHRHTRLVPQPIPIPQRRFSDLHVDLVGPLQYSNNFNNIFMIIDRTFKWMEAIPLSETSAAACAKALTFTWISRFGVPDQSLLIVGRNLLPAFGFNFAKCLTFHTNKQQLITLSRTAQLKYCTAASRMHFAHEPPRQHGLRSYPLYSSDFEHSQGKTRVFPWLSQFLVPKLSCHMNFCKMMNFQLMRLSNIFSKTLHVSAPLYLGTTLAPTCPASCQLSCSPPPPLGPSGWRHSTPSAALRRPLRGSAVRPPLFHHPSRVEGQGGRCQLPYGLHGSGHNAWQHATPAWQTTRLAPRQSCCNQTGLVFRPAGFFTFLFSGAATKRSWNHFPIARRFLHAQDRQCLHSLHRHGTCPLNRHRPRG